MICQALAAPSAPKIKKELSVAKLLVFAILEAAIVLPLPTVTKAEAVLTDLDCFWFKPEASSRPIPVTLFLFVEFILASHITVPALFT